MELLRLHSDPLGVGAAVEGVRGSGNALPIRPHERFCLLVTGLGPCTCWLRSDDELGKLLRVQRATERRLWDAVAARYLDAERRPVLVEVRRGRPVLSATQEALSLVNRLDLNGRGDGRSRMLVESWRPVDGKVLERSVDWLSAAFRGPLQLPVLTDPAGRRQVWA